MRKYINNPSSLSLLKLRNDHIPAQLFEILASKNLHAIHTTSSNTQILRYIVNKDAQKNLQGDPHLLLIYDYSIVSYGLIYGPIHYRALKYNPNTHKFYLGPHAYGQSLDYDVHDGLGSGVLLSRAE